MDKSCWFRFSVIPLGRRAPGSHEPSTGIQILSVDAKGGSSWSFTENNGREERLRLFKLLRPLAESSDMGLVARTLAEGSPASHLTDDFNHLVRHWARVLKTAEGAKAPRQVFQELPIQTRLVEIWWVAKPRLSSSMMQTYTSDCATI